MKCHTYWPGTQPIAFGEITVSLLSEYAFPDWVEREFLLEVEVCIDKLATNFVTLVKVAEIASYRPPEVVIKKSCQGRSHALE